MKKVDLTSGNVLKVLVALAIPIMGSSFLQFAYNIVDMLWVGRLGSSAVATVGTSSFFIGLGYSINSLILIGVGVKVAQAVGRKNNKEVKEYINIGLVLAGFLGIIYSIILIVFGHDFINFFNLQNEVLEKNAYTYLVISGPMLLFSFYNMLFTRILGGFGNNKVALKISSIGLILNIILDPILIYILNFGVKGAAIATLISQILIFILFMITKDSPFRFDKKLKISLLNLKSVIKLGLPMASQRILFTVVSIILARMISYYGTDAIAAQKIGLQVESITLMIIGGLNGAISAYTGQNFGAKKLSRINEGYHKALLIGMSYTVLTTIIFLIIPDKIAGLFVNQSSTIDMAGNYLIIIGIAQIFSAVEIISNGVFTGLGRPKIPATISIVFTLSRIPIAMFLSTIWGINGIWISIAFSSMLKGITAFLIYRFKIRSSLIRL